VSGVTHEALDPRRGVSATRTLVRSSAHAFAASILGVGLGLATSIVVSRSLGPQEKGVYDLLFSTATLFALVLGLSIPSGITFAVARKASSPRRLVVWVAGIGVVQAIVAFAVLAVLSTTDLAASLGLGTTDPAVMVVLALLVAALCVAPSLRGILVGNQRVALASWLDLLGRAITFLLLLVVALAAVGGTADADRFIMALLVGGVLGASLYLPAAVRTRVAGVGAGLGAVIRFATPSYGANVLQYLNYRVDLFLVAYFRDLREVGLYALAVSLAQLVWLVSNAVATAVFARVGSTSDEPQEAAGRTAALSRNVLVVQLALAGALALLAKPLLQVLYGPAFASAVSALWLLLPGVAVFGLGSVLAAHLAGLGRPNLNLWVAASSLVVTLTLDLLLIPSLGMNGAAVASSASYATTAVLTALLFTRITGLPLRSVLVPRRADLRRLLTVVRAVTR
jgi:O-antigen/teichoic acid export membrane protein